eukprot:7982120-Pyramimonas_sp.AAC.1
MGYSRTGHSCPNAKSYVEGESIDVKHVVDGNPRADEKRKTESAHSKRSGRGPVSSRNGYGYRC